MSICKYGDKFTVETIRAAAVPSLNSYLSRDPRPSHLAIITARDADNALFIGVDRGVNGVWAVHRLGAPSLMANTLTDNYGNLDPSEVISLASRVNAEFISNTNGNGNCVNMQRKASLSDEEASTATREVRNAIILNPVEVGDAILAAARAAMPAAGADPAALEEARAAKRAAERETAAANEKLVAIDKENKSLRAQLAAANNGKPQEIIHESLEDAEADIVDGLHLYLYGPAGTGKSHGARQIANRQGWKFASICEIRDEYADLLGFVAVDGKTRNETEFTRALDAAEQGEEVCIFFDEMDACVPEALTKLNSWLAGGTIEAAGKRYKMNKHIHVIAAGNTDGRGATAEYSSRSHLDAATLDRFSFIPWGYDARIMAYRAGGAEAGAWLTELQRVVSETGSDLLVSYRAADRVKVALKHESEGKGNLTQAIKNNVFRGLTVQSVRALVNRMKPTCPQLDAAAKAIVAA